jgi:hypothetical protein
MNTVPLHFVSVVSSAASLGTIDASSAPLTVCLTGLLVVASIVGYANAQCREYIRQMKEEGDRNWELAVAMHDARMRSADLG